MAGNTAVAKNIPILGAGRKTRNPWILGLQRFVQNRISVIGLMIILVFVSSAIFAPHITDYSYDEQNYLALNSAPQWVIDLFPQMRAIGDERGYVRVNDDYRLGTDGLGRDLFTRIVYGARISLAVAFIGPMTSLIVGTLFGMIAGFVGGRVDYWMMRFVDIMYAFPSLLLIILMMAIFRANFAASEPGSITYRLSEIDAAFGGMLFVFIGIGITSWMNTARLTRGQVLAIRQKEFIEAAESVGGSNLGILFRHVLPNVMGPVIVVESLAIPRYISLEAFLSFIGLGVNPPTPSWGNMIAEGSQAVRSYPHQAIFPALALFLIMFAFNFLGDGLRDALDPRSDEGNK